MRYVFTLFLVSLSLCSYAQNNIGAEVGLGFTNLNNDLLPDSRDGLTTVSPGVFYEIGFSDNFSIKNVVSIQPKGYKIQVTELIIFDENDPNFFQEEELKFKASYLVLNPLARYTTSGNIQFFANAGPFFGLLIKNESPVGKSLDVGLTAGLGLQFSLGDQQLFVEGRGNWGLTNTVDTIIDTGTDVKTQAYYILVGFSTPL